MNTTKSYRYALGATALIIGLALPSMAQYQPGPGAQPPYQGQPSYQGQPPYQGQGSYQGQPVYQGQPPYQGQPTYQGAQPVQPPQGAQAYAQVPPTLTIPAGTVLTVRLTRPVSSDHSAIGEEVHAVLDQPVVADGWVVARPGQTVLGRVAVAEKASHANNETSKLGVELTTLVLVDGQQVPLHTEMLQGSGGGIPGGQVAATVAVPTGMGALIGGAAGGGEGAAIGAVAGAAAGMIGVMLTHGRPTVIPPETELTFRQDAPVTVSTVNSAQAFEPVGQQDFNVQYQGGGYQGGPPPVQAYAGGPAPLPYRPYPYAYGYPYYGYGYPAYGFYWGPSFTFGFGPRFFVGGRFRR